MLHWIICSKNKNIGNILREVRPSILIKSRNWFMQELLWSFFSLLGNYRTLGIPAQIYFKIAFRKQLHRILCSKNKNCGNTFHSHEKKKLVHAAAPFVLLSLIGKLQELTNSCRKLPFSKLHWIVCSNARIFEIFCKK